MVCELELVGIDAVGSAPNRRLSPSGSGDPIVVLHLPPQHVTEQVFLEHKAPHGRLEDPIGSRAAGPSRVAFRIDPGVFPVDYKLAAILELLAASDLAVPASAARGPQPSGCLNIGAVLQFLLNPPGLAPPGGAETALELPFRLILSPEGEAGFSHKPRPMPGKGSTRNELWHSLLEPAPDREGREVRAIWLRQGDGLAWNPAAPKWTNPKTGDDEPFDVNTMNQRDRADIVHLSGNRRYGLQTQKNYIPKAIPVRRLGLSSLGSWLDLHAEWDPPTSITSLIEWVHRATQGRDQFVRLVNVGYVYPFGHQALLVRISERKFVPEEPPPGDPPLLLQRQFIVIRQPVKVYEPGAAPPAQAHTMPLKEVRIRTLVTPPLEPVSATPLITEAGETEPFPFKVTGTDFEGNKVDLATPLVWIISTDAWDPTTIANAKALYGTRELDARGANIAIAPGTKKNGELLRDTTYPTEQISFSAEPRPPGPDQDKEPGFWPEVVTADVRAPALEIVAGENGTAKLAYHPTYRQHGVGGANLNEVIAELKGSPLGLDFGDKGDRAGGLIQPSMSIEGLSRQLGPVGGKAADLAELAAGKFDPTKFFAGASPKLFGVFELKQVLGIITGTKPSDVPRIVTEGGADALAAKQVWHPVPVSYPGTNPMFVVEKGVTAMEVVASFDARKASDPQANVRATLTDFRIHLLGDPTFLKLTFEKVEFAAEAGRKPDVDVVMGEIVFAGPLSFVEEIKKVIPLNGFSDPPALDITPAGVRSSFSLGLPDIAVGVFALQNVSLGAGFSIPFTDGALTVNFNFCKREEPFLLTVSLFGGGGFFGISIDPNGVQMLEASLEFGASAAINLGVAQGGVHVMAGIYFKIESGKGCTLTGYFRLGGEMSVLGLISASIELNLSFTYKDPGKAFGRAVVSVEIDIFLFSFSVEVECERQFAGSESDPAFEELMGVDPWDEYCAAYA